MESSGLRLRRTSRAVSVEIVPDVDRIAAGHVIEKKIWRHGERAGAECPRYFDEMPHVAEHVGYENATGGSSPR